MASLVEELVNVLVEENTIYGKLLDFGEQKKQIVIAADIGALEKLTALEQEASDALLVKSNKQASLLNDIATVLGKTQEQMTVTKLIGYLDTQPDMQKKLIQAKENLLETAKEVQIINSSSILSADTIQ